MSVRSFLIGILVLFVAGLIVLGSFADRQSRSQKSDDMKHDEIRVLVDVSETKPVRTGLVSVEGLGEFTFDPGSVEALRDDIFQEAYFSIFDVLVHLKREGLIEMEYSFDENMNTYVISSLDGRESWWYSAYYDGGWPERSVFRMDHYPYKDNMTLRFVQTTQDYLDSVYETYLDEVQRRNENDGRIVVPEVVIKGRHETLVFRGVEIIAHNMRNDMFKPGVITALDVIISLGEAGEITYDLQWYESIGSAGVVKSYWVNRINKDESYQRCGFVYEVGDEQFRFFRGNHIHIPSDTRVINSPEYVEFFWICI